MTIVYPVRRDRTFVIPEAMFRTKTRPTHGGIDFTPVKQGHPEPVYAVESGRIVIADRTAGPVGDTSGMDVMVLTSSGRRWWYGHLSRVDVYPGDAVGAGKQLGLMGTTGSSATGKASSSGVHLHLELHYPAINVEIDPWPWIAKAPDIAKSTLPPAESREKAIVQLQQKPEETINTIYRGDDEDMFVCKQNSTGHVYTVGKQFIRHEEVLETAQYVANVLTFEDTIIGMNDTQFLAILDSHGIPRSAPKATLRGKLWSVATGVTDTRNT